MSMIGHYLSVYNICESGISTRSIAFGAAATHIAGIFTARRSEDLECAGSLNWKEAGYVDLMAKGVDDPAVDSKSDTGCVSETSIELPGFDGMLSIRLSPQKGINNVTTLCSPLKLVKIDERNFSWTRFFAAGDRRSHIVDDDPVVGLCILNLLRVLENVIADMDTID